MRISATERLSAPQLAVAGWVIWGADQGAQDVDVPSHLKLIDIQLGGTASDYLVLEQLPGGERSVLRSTSRPKSFSLLPSGKPREIKTT